MRGQRLTRNDHINSRGLITANISPQSPDPFPGQSESQYIYIYESQILLKKSHQFLDPSPDWARDPLIRSCGMLGVT